MKEEKIIPFEISANQDGCWLLDSDRNLWLFSKGPDGFLEWSNIELPTRKKIPNDVAKWTENPFHEIEISRRKMEIPIAFSGVI
jgi:hypothetical protein